ncbi:MAG: hypothetical protein H6733_11720 [Alphaproteobacteria bacterium]|nr:hypothetical protein [Alphaproteobacteria bacterium]
MWLLIGGGHRELVVFNLPSVFRQVPAEHRAASMLCEIFLRPEHMAQAFADLYMVLHGRLASLAKHEVPHSHLVAALQYAVEVGGNKHVDRAHEAGAWSLAVVRERIHAREQLRMSGLKVFDASGHRWVATAFAEVDEALNQLRICQERSRVNGPVRRSGARDTLVLP